MVRANRGKAKAPPESSPLSSAPSLPESPSYTPAKAKRTPRVTYSKRKSSGKRKQAAIPKPPSSRPRSSSPPLTSNLDDLLGDMGRDLVRRKKQAQDRQIVLESLDRDPSSSQPRAAVTPRKLAKRKRGKEAPQYGEDELPSPQEGQHTPSPTQGIQRPEEERGSPESSASSMTPPPPTSPPPARFRPLLAGPSFSTRYSSSAVTDDEEDAGNLKAALLGMGSKSPKMVNGGVEDDDDDELTPPPSPAWQPTRLPPLVELGSTCLVKVLKQWFPAKLVAYTPSLDPHGKDFYEVETQDGVRYKPTRNPKAPSRHSLLWLDEQDAIAKVSLGQYDIKPRISSAVIPLPPDANDYDRFRVQSLHDQIASLHDHLADLVAERYAPAQWRIDKFFNSPKDRAHLRSETEYGDFTMVDAKCVVTELTAWVKECVERGSARFEDLQENERSSYANDVLLPEVMIRICLRSLDLDRPSSWTRPPPGIAQGLPAGNDTRTRHDVDEDGAGAQPPGAAAATDEERLYKLARAKLRELAKEDHATEWERRRMEVSLARKPAVARRVADVPAPKISARAERMMTREGDLELHLQQAFDRRNERKGHRRGRARSKAASAGGNEVDGEEGTKAGVAKKPEGGVIEEEDVEKAEASGHEAPVIASN